MIALLRALHPTSKLGITGCELVNGKLFSEIAPRVIIYDNIIIMTSRTTYTRPCRRVIRIEGS